MVSELHTQDIFIIHGTSVHSYFQRFNLYQFVLQPPRLAVEDHLLLFRAVMTNFSSIQVTEAETDENRQKRGTDQGLMELLRMSSQSGKTLEADQVFVSHPYIVILFPNIFFICDFQSLDISVAGPGFPRGDRPMYFRSSSGASEKKTTNYILFLDGMLYKMCSNLEILCLQNVLCPYVRCPVEPPNRTCQQTEVLAGYIRGRQCLRCAACIDDAPDLLESDQYQPPHWFQWRILQIE